MTEDEMPKTAQEIFDYVARHLLTQGKKSVLPDTEDVCAYRGKDDCKCAAGCLIPDDRYKPEFEQKLWNTAASFGIAQHFPEYLEFLGLIRELQLVHDRYEPEAWKEALVEVAQVHHLDFSVVQSWPT